MLCGAEEACPAHNRKVGGSKPPKAIQALAQLVERSTVVVYKHRTAAGSIPASLKQPLFIRFAGKVVQNLSGILLHFFQLRKKSVFGRIVK